VFRRRQAPKLLALLLLVVATLAGRESGAVGRGSRLALTVTALSNTVDWETRSECEDQGEIEAGRKYAHWIAFGQVKPQRGMGWEAVSSATRCGRGVFDQGSVVLGRTLGIPYIIVDVETIPFIRPTGKVELRTTLKVRLLSAIDGKGQPIYARSERKRTFELGAAESALVPLLVADAGERDAFNVHELFLRQRARVLGRQVAAYGAISVTADAPNANIFLDGGMVGRTLAGGATVLQNIRAGAHEIRVSDFSERAASKQVVVERNRTTAVDVKLLNLPSAPTSVATLLPIGRNPQGFEEYWRQRDGAVVVKVPAGWFPMGSPEGQGFAEEHPQHEVFLSDFAIDKTEVTWPQFRRYAEATGAGLPPTPLWGTPEDYPATSVLYHEAQAYCRWVGGTLPTEAQWEKAARGTDGQEYPWGNDWDIDRCNSIQGGPHRPQGVASFPGCVSPYGVVDMAGSVWEWVADWYDRYPEMSALDPKGPDRGDLRVRRGGSWLSMSTYLRTAYRHKIDPDWRDTHNGFRCAQHAPQ